MREMNKFSLGQIVATIGVSALMEHVATNVLLQGFLGRHRQGDWGDTCPHDVKVNEDALKHGDRLMSVYKLPDDTTIWIITEADRSVTTLLLPEEY